MPQLVNSQCVVCHERIRGAADSEFCQECGNPVHQKCLVAFPEATELSQCPRCKGDKDSQTAFLVRAERQAAIDEVRAAEIRQHGYPKSWICPSCGSKEFTQVRTSQSVSLGDDRICKECQTRYTPPTPIWAAILFILIGCAFIVAALLDLLQWSTDLNKGQIHPARIVASALVVILAIGGYRAIRFGICCLRMPGKH